MSVSRPYGCHEIASVLPLAEVSFFHTFLVNIVAAFHFYTGINNGDQTKLLVFHLFYKIREIREILRIQSKVLIGIHIINVHVDHIQRDVILTIAGCHLAKILLGAISPSALPKAKCKLRRNIAASDHMTELLYNVISRLTHDHIHIQICICTCHLQGIHSGVPNVKGQFRRIIEK